MAENAGHRYPRVLRWARLVRCLPVLGGGAANAHVEKVRWWLGGCYVVVVLLVAYLVLPLGPPLRCLVQHPCAPGDLEKVSVHGRTEYTGVTGTYPFRPDLTALMGALEKQNRQATKGGAGTYVTVAVGGPLSGDDPRTRQRIEGAIAGQYDANNSGLVGDRPRIRLVLANMDSVEGHWKPVAGRLLDMADDEDHPATGGDHLVAVAGMGLSQAETVDAMDVLRGRHVATISDMITASTITQRTYPPFVRVGPDTGQQLDALSQYLRPRLVHHKAMLVSYSKRTDMYTSALNADFQRYLGGPWRAGGRIIAPFGDNPGNEFGQIVRILCGSRGIDTVYYAGRASDLSLFLTYLGNRPGCAGGKVTVVTTSDTSRLLADTPDNHRTWQAMREHRPIDLIYTPLADPAFLSGRSGSRRPIVALDGVFDHFRFPRSDLDTGWAIMAHDAVMTAAQATRTAAGDEGRVPPPRAVADQLRLMSAPSTAVPGASGQVRLDPLTGDRYDLRIPVLRFVPGRQSTVLGSYRPARP